MIHGVSKVKKNAEKGQETMSAKSFMYQTELP